MDTCAGCNRTIDVAFDSFVRDNFGRPWHTACMTRSRGATGREDQQTGAGPLWAWAIVTLIMPIVGLVVGLVYLFRNRIGPGLALVIEAVALFAVYAVLISSANAAVTGDWGAYAVVASTFSVPLPDVYVHRADCPDATIDDHLAAASCSSSTSREIWLPDWAFDRFTLAHELGHQFDRQYLTDEDRTWLRRVMHAPTKTWFSYAGADEWFADYYADCATRAWRRGSESTAAYAPLPTPTRLTRVCFAIKAIRTRPPAPTAFGS